VSSVTLAIEGMHCTGCAATIEMLLAAEAGVRGTAVSFDSKSARIEYDESVTGEERIAAVIEKAGYRVLRPG
jgi:copper chaperone CopZ